jgi:hypothetical protein
VLYRYLGNELVSISGGGDGAASPPSPEAIAGEALWFVQNGEARVVRDPAVLEQVSRLVTFRSVAVGLSSRAVAAELAARLETLRDSAAVDTAEIRNELAALVDGIAAEPSQAGLEARLREMQDVLAAHLRALTITRAQVISQARAEAAIAAAEAESERLARIRPDSTDEFAERLSRLLELAIESGRAVPSP